MSHHSREAPPITHGHRGFSLVEVSLAMVVLALLWLIGTPRVSRYMTELRVQRATAVVATDLEQAFAMAGRQRKPVRIDCNCASMTYTVTDRLGGTIRLTRTLGSDADYKLTTLTFSTTPVDVFPSGIASAPLTVTVGAERLYTPDHDVERRTGEDPAVKQTAPGFGGGFTLVEIMVAMVILGMMALTLAPLMLRATRTATAAEATMYQPAAMSTEVSTAERDEVRPCRLGTACVTLSAPPLPYTRCTTVTS